MFAANAFLGRSTSGVALPTITYTATAFSNTDLTTYSFTGVSVGAVVPNRLLIVGVGGYSGNVGTNRTINSLTVDGAATATAATATGAAPIAFFTLALTTQTSVNISVVASGAMANLNIGAWVATDLTSATPIDNQTATATTHTVTLTTAANGVVVGLNGTLGTTTTGWTGITSNYVTTMDSSTFVSGASGLSTGTSLVVTAATTATGARILAVSWR